VRRPALPRPIDVRDRVVLLLGFAGSLRRSELANLHVDDIEEVPEDLLLPLRSKTGGIRPPGRSRLRRRRRAV
jgi:site-specific recombinase XerC